MKFRVYNSFIIIIVMALLLPIMAVAQENNPTLGGFVFQGEVIGVNEEWRYSLQNSGAIVFHEGQFHMFRNGYYSLPGNSVVGYSTSPDGIDWTHYENNPVFRTEDVPYAETMIMATSVHVAEDGTWVLYFLMWDAGTIGRATAPAPIGPWTPDSEAILAPSDADAWDNAKVTHPNVLVNDDGYVMYYTGIDENRVERTGMATSADGITWTKHPEPILELGADANWDENAAARGLVVESTQGFVMVYRARAFTGGYNYGLATSSDGINWQKLGDQPFLTRDDLPDVRSLFFPTFLYHDETFYFFIEGYRGSSRIYLLTSTGEEIFDIE